MIKKTILTDIDLIKILNNFTNLVIIILQLLLNHLQFYTNENL